MPPIRGMQASAAATFEGKPVDVDFGPSSGPGLDGGERNRLLIGHDLHTPNAKSLVKQSRVRSSFRFRSPFMRNMLRAANPNTHDQKFPLAC